MFSETFTNFMMKHFPHANKCKDGHKKSCYYNKLSWDKIFDGKYISSYYIKQYLTDPEVNYTLRKEKLTEIDTDLRSPVLEITPGMQDYADSVKHAWV